MRPDVAVRTHQVCAADQVFAAVLLISLLYFLRGPNLTLHHGKYVRALDAED